MARLNHDIYCPVCDLVVPEVDVDWLQVRAYCQRCEQELMLVGYVEPPVPDPGLPERAYRPLDLEKPSGLALERSAIPGVESFKLGGRVMHGQVRVERDALVFKGFLGRERQTPLEEVQGFAALQRVAYPDGEGRGLGEVRWHVVAVLTDDMPLRVWEYDERDEARYLASELNRALLFIRSSAAAQRD